MGAFWAALVAAMAAERGAEAGALQPAASGLYVEFGRGVRLTPEGAPFELVLRGRLQVRGTAVVPAEPPPDLSFEVRRARLALLGEARDLPIDLYLQLGLGASDLEPELPVPLRDGVITWRPHRDASFRFGQMKVPFSRQRMVSSSALQFVDRAIVNAELNLDRDIGAQWFSNDLFGWDGRVAAQVGVFGGDGRNRRNQGSGLLYAGRVQIQPFGGFDDVFAESDLTRSRKLRVSVGVAAGRNVDARRSRSTFGDVLEGSYDLDHGALDAMAKWRGWSLQSEAISRVVRAADRAPEDEAPTSGWGAMAQLGYLFPSRWEVAGRFAHVGGLNGATDPLPDREEAHVALGHYFARHDLKLQGDVGLAWAAEAPPTPTGRLQLQVFF